MDNKDFYDFFLELDSEKLKDFYNESKDDNERYFWDKIVEIRIIHHVRNKKTIN